MSVLAGSIAAVATLAAVLAVGIGRGSLSDDLETSAGAAGKPGRLPPELAWSVAAACVGAAIGSIALSAVGAAVGLTVPRFVERRRRKRTQQRAREQLPDAIGAMAAAIRAGLSLSRAVAFAADESVEPLGASLKAVGVRETMGVPLTESLETWCGEIGTDEARLVGSVLDLHRRTGGGFAAVLDRLARTLRAREAIIREVQSLTAQARLSGAILGFLPFGFFAFLMVTSPDDMAAAYRSPVGLMAIATGLCLQGAAFLWIRSLLRVGT